MKKNNYHLWGCLALVVCSTLYTNAQQSLNASGNSDPYYSVGEVFFTTLTGTGGSAGQGIGTLDVASPSISDARATFSITAFPNPTADHITLQVEDTNFSKLSYQLFDIQGRQLDEGKLEGKSTQIDMLDLAPAVYFVRILNPKTQKVESLKILKQ